jgi:CoA:oxalate CoA-transferase
MTPETPMLTGYRVLDITQFVAGPTCTRILAELGADVIKLELAPHGDRSRIQGIKPREPKGSSQSTYFFQHNHSKRSLALQWKHPRSTEIIKAIVAKSDVLVENFAPGVMARAGLGYEELRSVNPRLVMCSISVAGQSGPLSLQPGYDYIAAAYAGVTDQIGEADGSPAQFSIAIGDVSTGVAAAMAVGFALLHRERTGEGQYIDSAILDTYFHMHEVNVPRVALRGDKFTPKRTGSQHPDGGPTGLFRCSDGRYINITALAHQWEQIAAALGQPELVDDPRFRDARARRDNNDAIKSLIETWLARLPDRASALSVLEKHRVPCAPVLTLNEAAAHPHLRERGTVRRVEDAEIGAFDIPGLPVKFSRWAARADVRADRLGEHNEEVLKELVGLSDAEIASLYEEKVLVIDPELANERPPVTRENSRSEGA